MRRFHVVSLATLLVAILSWPASSQAQLTTNLTDPTYLAVIQNSSQGGLNGPCGIGGGNGYALCTGGGIPLSYFATAASVDSKIASAIGQLGQQGVQAAMQAQQGAIQAQQTALQSQRGVSAVAAMANIWMPSAPGRTTWAVNGSAFAGEFGTGFSVAHRLPLSIPVAITAAYGNGAGSAHVGRIGLMGEF